MKYTHGSEGRQLVGSFWFCLFLYLSVWHLVSIQKEENFGTPMIILNMKLWRNVEQGPISEIDIFSMCTRVHVYM